MVYVMCVLNKGSAAGEAFVKGVDPKRQRIPLT